MLDCTLRHCCVTFFVKDLFKCKKSRPAVVIAAGLYSIKGLKSLTVNR